MADMTGTGDLGARVEELESRLRELEHRERKTNPVKLLMRELLPAEARDHMRAARREQLLAVRSVIDHWIERAEHEETGDKHERITLD